MSKPGCLISLDQGGERCVFPSLSGPLFQDLFPRAFFVFVLCDSVSFRCCKKYCMELQQKSMKSSVCITADHHLPKPGLDVTDGDNAVTGE